jgi:hypothetical protein
MRGSLETKRARTPLECTAKTAPRSPETAFFQFHTGADFQKSFGCRPDAVERDVSVQSTALLYRKVLGVTVFASVASECLLEEGSVPPRSVRSLPPRFGALRQSPIASWPASTV